MIRVGSKSVKLQTDGIVALLSARRDQLLGSVRVLVSPAEPRAGGGSNAVVLGYLSRHSPPLTDTRGGDVDQAMGTAVRAAFEPWSSTLRGLAPLAGEALARAIAARLRSGRYVTNTAETLADKARRGAGSTPGVDSEQLANALDRATVRVEE
jgi:hypothetical protein